jgi:hypothetical protein
MMMMKTRAIKLLGLLAVLLSLHTTAIAGYFLPESSLWQGSRFYNQDGVKAYVEYAVYDTAASDYENIFNGAKDCFVNPGSGQYIYAYEVYNQDSSNSLDPITTFELLGGNPSAADGIGSQNNGNGSIAATNDGDSFVWKFENAVFIGDKHSVFMVFSSDAKPKAGTLKLSTLTESGSEPPVNDDSGNTPEPTTLAMLAVGATSLLARRKRVSK